MTVTTPATAQTVKAGSEKRLTDATDTLPVSTTGTSASAAFARSLFLFLGLMFRRPSKLFRPSRVDTWAGLRQLALSANQSLSPSFIRSLVRSRTGIIAVGLSIIPPLLINTTLGFLLFTSHSFFSLSLARLSFFQHHHHEPENNVRLVDDFGFTQRASRLQNEDEEDVIEAINIHSLLSGPTIIPSHPTLLSALAGAGAGFAQGAAFTPIENIVRLLSESATSLSALVIRVLRLPTIQLPVTSTISNTIPSSPLQAVRNFLSSDTWRKSPSWWTGWRWAVARDAISYSVFFAAFDMTRRAGLRVKALFGGSIQAEWSGFLSINPSHPDHSARASSAPDATPTVARIAQATTIVAGGITASLAAEFAGRPIRACQKILETSPMIAGQRSPILQILREQGIRSFLRNPSSQVKQAVSGSRVQRAVKRLGWRMAAVGPWGFGFLVWAWVGGEV